MRYPSKVRIREVSPRDGLQAEPVTLSAQAKVELIDRLSAAGLPQVNATSFVRPDAVPQLADAADVMARIKRAPGVVYDATVPNVVGARRAIQAGADAVSVFVAASEGGSKSNVKRGTEEAMREAERVVELARAAGLDVIGTVSTAFGSAYEGTVPPERVLDLARRFVAAGVTSLAIGDTSGEGTPRQVAAMVRTLAGEFGDFPVALHLHDTRGFALANVLAALDEGATSFDAAVGGIGGSPYTRNSAGNVATEELVHMCHEAGIETGVDLDALLDTYQFLEQVLGHPLAGRLGRVGPSKTVTVIQ
jgi:hydroxymethylglutaryl-CoA lyase